MGDMLSQAEIDALLSGALSMDDEPAAPEEMNTNVLSPQEIDALGEIGNISMGTSATTLYTLLGQKVMITTPQVSVITWESLSKEFQEPFVAVKVQYTHGLTGANLLIMKEEDVKIITDLMMGGSGLVDHGTELSELHLSAISEAMNQMVGSSATSLSSMFDKRVDISPPVSQLIHLGEDTDRLQFENGKQIVKIAFSLKVGNIIDSNIMQLLPVAFAKELVANLLKHGESEQPKFAPKPAEKTAPPQKPIPQQPVAEQQPQYTPPQQQPVYNQPEQPVYGYPQMPQMPYIPPIQQPQNPVNVSRLSHLLLLEIQTLLY